MHLCMKLFLFKFKYRFFLTWRLSARKPSYPTVADRSVTPNNAYAYPSAPVAANNPSKIMAVNHPMPLSSIYATQGNNNYANHNNPMHQPQYQPPPPPPTSTFNPAANQQLNSAALSAQPTSLYNPTQSSSSSAALQNQPPSYMHTKPPVAWNDPPVVTPKIKVGF